MIMGKKKVMIGRVEDYSKVDCFVEEVFDQFKVKFEDEVLIKPNFLKFDNPLSGSITHPNVVKSVVRVLKEMDTKPIVAEGGFRRDAADECFTAFKLKEIASCVNLNKEKFFDVKVGGKVLKEVKIAKTALKAVEKPFISLPKMKVHGLTKVTLGIKNNIGFLKKPAIYMHFRINQKLVDLLNLFNPALTIIDGVIGGETSELSTKPVKHGVMVASDSVVAADIVASKLMGFDDVEHIKIAAREFGIDSIEVNQDIEEFKVNYSLSFLSRGRGLLGT